MRTVQMLGNAKVQVQEIAKPQPPAGVVLIQVMASGVCRSEYGAYLSPTGRDSNEGHEAAGIVVDASKSRRWTNGDRVGVHAVWGCGRCEWCRAGKYTYCPDRFIMERAHSEFILAPDHAICRLPDDCPFDIGVLITGCTIGHAFHCQNLLGTQQGEFVVIVGLGPTGLAQSLVQLGIGANVIAIDKSDDRLALARRLGVAWTVNSEKTDAIEAVKEITRGRLAPRGIECAGQPDAVHLAIQCVGPGGKVLCSGEQGVVPIAINKELIRRDITLLGTWYYHYCEYPSLVEFYKRAPLLDRLITHRFPLEGADEAYRLYETAPTGKIILEPNK